MNVTESRARGGRSRRSRMGDDEDEEPVDPKAPLTEECMKTRTCARLLVSGEKLRSHAIVACCLNSANNFAPFVCRLSTRSARSASRPRAREIAPGSTWTTSRAPINARRTLSLKRSNNGRRCIDGFSSIFSHGRWQPRSTPGSRCARRSTLVTAVRQLIYSM